MVFATDESALRSPIRNLHVPPEIAFLIRQIRFAVTQDRQSWSFWDSLKSPPSCGSLCSAKIRPWHPDCNLANRYADANGSSNKNRNVDRRRVSARQVDTQRRQHEEQQSIRRDRGHGPFPVDLFRSSARVLGDADGGLAGDQQTHGGSQGGGGPRSE